MLDKDYLLEIITEEQILSILRIFGTVPYGLIKPKEIWFRTICHNGNSHKLCYFRETKSFYCYTNCGAMSLFSLIMKVRECSFAESINYLASQIGFINRKGFNQRRTFRNNDIAKINQYIAMRNPVKKSLQILPSISSDILNYFESDVFYQGWIDEGIGIKSMQRFGIRWYELEKHIIIPHLNIDGDLVGVRRRSLQQKDIKNKYMPEMIEGNLFGHSLGLNLYGLYENKSAIQRFKKAVIVESEKSVLLATEYYGDNAFVVATCGFNVSNWQRDMLLQLGIDEIILGFDKDFNELDFLDYDENDPAYKEYMRYINRIYSLAHKFTPYCRTYVLWDREGDLSLKSSPFDCGKETLEKLMRNKIEINTEREEER